MPKCSLTDYNARLTDYNARLNDYNARLNDYIIVTVNDYLLVMYKKLKNN